MMRALEGGGGAPFPIGRVPGRAVALLAAHPFLIAVAVLLFGAAPDLLYPSILDLFDVGARVRGEIRAYAVASASLLIGLPLGAVVDGVAARLAVGDEEAGTVARAVAAALLPLVALQFLLLLALLGGLVLLIVPGVLAAVVWVVASQALVVERLGVGAALSRSRDLTRGARWRVLGMVVVLVIIEQGLAFGVGALGGAADGLEASEAALGPGLGRFWWAGVAVSSAFSAAVWAVFPAALYVELREWKEGPATDRLAEVFA